MDPLRPHPSVRSRSWSDEGIEVDAETERVASLALDVGFAVHSAVGPGARENVYARLLDYLMPCERTLSSMAVSSWR